MKEDLRVTKTKKLLYETLISLMEEKSFEENLEQLEGIVKKLESGDIPLDDAIKEFNQAMDLAKLCDEKLKKAEKSLTKIVKEDGSLEDFAAEKE